MDFRSIFNNPFTFGVTLGTSLILGYILPKLFQKSWNSMIFPFMTSVRLTGLMRNGCSQDDNLYHSVLKLIASIMDMEKFTNDRTVSVLHKQLEHGQEGYEFNSPPDFGIHYFCYNGQPIKIERRQQPELNCEKIPCEFLKLTTLKWKKDILYELLTEARESQRKHDEKKTSFFCISYGDWSNFGDPKRRRLLDSVIMADGVKEKLLKDVQEFLASEDWYTVRGIPYRRGFLLHGGPGNGKSSMIRAIAGEIGYDICILSLSSKDLTDDELNKLMNTAPEKSIILLEDADAAFSSRESADDKTRASHLAYEGSGSSKVTFRGLLNALDGVASTEGRMVFITTNYLEKLDPALVRPGRTDVRILVDYPTEDQLSRMFDRFYPDSDEETRDDFVKTVISLDKKVSMASIQGIFLMFKDNPKQVVENAVDYLNDNYFNKS